MTDIVFPMRIAADVTVSADIIDSLLWTAGPAPTTGTTASNTQSSSTASSSCSEIEVDAEDAEDEHGEQINGRRYTIDGHTWLKGMQRAFDEGEYGFSDGIPSFDPDEWDSTPTTTTSSSRPPCSGRSSRLTNSQKGAAMSWLNVTVKIPASWWPDRDESEYPFNVFAYREHALQRGTATSTSTPPTTAACSSPLPAMPATACARSTVAPVSSSSGASPQLRRGRRPGRRGGAGRLASVRRP